MSRYDRYMRNLIHERIKVFMLAISVVFLGLILRLYFLQILDKNNLKLQALKQRSVEINLNSNRGTIYDRNSIPLTNNRTRKFLIGEKKYILNNKILLQEIQKHTSLSNRSLNELLRDNDNLAQIPIYGEIDFVDENVQTVDIVERYSRKNVLSHVIGYVNKAENRGVYGIEKVYDEFLNRSDTSSVFVEYDKKRTMVLGMSTHVDKHLESEDPAGVRLTIDSRIQRAVENILDERKDNGAVIVADIESAEILALASRPNFNQENMEEYFHREDMVLLNKAIQISYPPGSIFKIIVLLSALEEDIIFTEKNYFCKGYEEIGSLTVECNNLHGHGTISLKDGFAKSCNSVFIQIGQEIGAKKIIDMAKRMGMGENIGIGLLEEVNGFLPEGEGLLGPVIGHISIGQDKIEVTPLQITNALLIIANGGIKKDMTIIKGITTKDGKLIKEYNKVEDDRILKEDLCKYAKEYLEEVTKTGTARNLDLDNIGGSAGKTGSAEAVLKGQPSIHGWFTGYYPRINPKYVITVSVEKAASGSRSAAPIFESICKEIYKINN